MTNTITMNSKYERWEKSESIGNMTKRVSVKKVENGYVIEISKYGTEEGSEKYIDECKTYISTKNPLESLSPSTDTVELGADIIKSLKSIFD